MHSSGWIDKAFEAFNAIRGAHYISLYDHGDKYTAPMYDTLVSKILATKNSHWRTTPSTCGSFMLTPITFDQDYDVLFGYPGDHQKFLNLTRDKGRVIITPIPGLSTHCAAGLLSPVTNWKL